MTMIILVLGLGLAIALLSLAVKVQSAQLRGVMVAASLIVVLFFFAMASFRHVGENQLGVVIKNVGTRSLPPGQIIATNGEKGPQAAVLPPGWHPWLWPFIYDIEYYPVTRIKAGSVGILTAADGEPLPPDTTYAPEWDTENAKAMAQDAEFFLTDGKGYKGPQTSVLRPGAYRINPKLFAVREVPVVTIEKATVGVVKSNVGERAKGTGERVLVERTQRGIWREPLLEGQYYKNTDAYEITKISTRKTIIRYTAAGSKRDAQGEESEIRVRTTDGFTFPVDVRVEYEIRPDQASRLVATVGDDQQGLRGVLNSAVRAIFRNNAETVKALDYVQQRSQQESQSLQMLISEMDKLGVTVTAVRIGDVGNEETLGKLLETQTNREIALQEQETFREQQRAAEQKKQLSRTEQEADEERRLATAAYGVKIAEEEKKRRIIDAGAEAEAIKIEATARAEAYGQIAKQIGRGNAALVELLKVVGERGISITPRVMVVGGNGDGSTKDGETTALIGTMLDSMIDRQEQPAQK